jgi:TFIIF-interacting CTD phosphatase-like protein
LYRQHTTFEDEVYVKDLGLVGRDLDKMLIVDNTKDNFKYHKENGITVDSWFDDENDQVLLDLANILVLIATNNPSDIRDELVKWRKVLDSHIQLGEKVPEKYFKIQ